MRAAAFLFVSRMSMYKISTLIATLCLLPACVGYRPAPIDLARNTEQWRQLSASLCPGGKALSRSQVQRIGLMLNPELNEARLTHARSTAVAECAGLWEDPSVSADVTRVFQESVTNRGVGLSLALPLTGLPGIAKKVAEQYKEADYWTVREKERAYLEQLDTLHAAILLTHAKHGLMKKRLVQLRDERDRIARLHELGEASFSEYQVTNQRLNDTIKEEQELANEHLAKHLELTNLMGLHPDCRHVEVEESLSRGIPSALAAPTPAELLENPGLRAKLAGYGGSEQELRAEIRRQYPQLSLGPVYSYEAGNDKLGMGLSFNLPLWNRNREAIARATGDRALRQAETITAWRNLMQQASSLADRQKLALRHCRTERERLDTLTEAARRQEQLFELGETKLPELAETRHEVYQRQISYLDCLGTLMELQVKLRYLATAQQ